MRLKHWRRWLHPGRPLLLLLPLRSSATNEKDQKQRCSIVEYCKWCDWLPVSLCTFQHAGPNMTIMSPPWLCCSSGRSFCSCCSATRHRPRCTGSSPLCSEPSPCRSTVEFPKCWHYERNKVSIFAHARREKTTHLCLLSVRVCAEVWRLKVPVGAALE